MTNEENEPDTEDKSELRARLEAAKKRKEEARAKREALESKGEYERRVLAEEQAAKDEEALLDAESQIGASKIATVDTPLGTIIIKRPNPLHFKRFQDKESVKTKDLEQLVRPCVVYPNGSRFDQILEELPATLTRCADRVATLAGVRVREITGK